MWVADPIIGKVFAYDMATTTRARDREFDVLETAGNSVPRGVWSDGITTWVSDSEDVKIYAYYTERAVLAAFYDATGGAGWTNSDNWLSGEPVGQWHGVETNSEGRVTGLDLRDNALTGEIPADLGNLPDLKELWFNGNRLTGQIPAALGRLEHLSVLHLSGNQLTGCVPAALMDLEESDLDQLGLDFCAPTAAARAISDTVLPPGGEATVTIEADGYGGAGQVIETLPPGFAIVATGLPRGPGHGHRPVRPGGDLRAGRGDILHLHRCRARPRGRLHLLRRSQGL